MESKKKQNPFLRIIFILFLLFLMIYILSVSGYYENKMHLKTTITQERIMAFEDDVKNGVEIDLNKYINNEEKNYNNMFTKIGDNIGTFASQSLGGKMNNFWQIFKVLFG